MYHIKEDKRAKASVELICDGLKRCLKEKSFESVTISDIRRVSGVSRSTFYRNFDRIEGVLALMCDRVFEEAFLSDYANISEAVFRKPLSALTAATCCTQACAAVRAVCAPDCPNREMRRCWIILRP